MDWWLTVYMSERAGNAMPRLLQLACSNSRLDALQFLHKQGRFEKLQGPVKVECYTMETATWIYDNLRNATTVKYIYNYRSPDGLAMLKLAHARGIMVTGRAFNNSIGYSISEDAACADNLEVLRWIQAQGIEQCSKQALNSAIISGRLHVMQWLYDQYPRGYFDEITGGCCDVDTIQWTLRNCDWSSSEARKEWITTCLYNTWHFSDPKVEAIECLFVACPEADECGGVMEAVARSGDLKALKQLHAHGAKATSTAMDSAAIRGHLDVVR